MRLSSTPKTGCISPKRPREKILENGVENLNDAELLSVILGTGYKNLSVKELSQHLLSQFGTRGLFQFQQLDYFQQETGLPFVKSCILLAIGEYFRRLKQKDDTQIKSSQQLYEYIKDDFKKTKFEQLRLVCTDAKRRVLFSGLIAQGKANKLTVTLADVLHNPIRLNATHFYLAHNHPSGAMEPSQEDYDFTLQIKDTTSNFGIQFSDHLVIGEGGFYSFALNGIL